MGRSSALVVAHSGVARRKRSGERFDLADYKALENVFEAKPEIVLSWFEELGISCLMELGIYAAMRKKRPETAARIAVVALSMGIKETPDG